MTFWACASSTSLRLWLHPLQVGQWLGSQDTCFASGYELQLLPGPGFSICKMGLMITNLPSTSSLWGGVFKWIILCIEMSQQISSLWRKDLIYYHHQLTEQKFHLSPLPPLQCCMNWEPYYLGEMTGLCTATQILALGIPGGLGRPARASCELRQDSRAKSRAGTSCPNTTAEVWSFSTGMPSLGCESWERRRPALKLFFFGSLSLHVDLQNEKREISKKKEREWRKKSKSLKLIKFWYSILVKYLTQKVPINIQGNEWTQKTVICLINIC